MEELDFPQKTVTIHEDNQACILLSKNPQDHKRTKHIQIRFHFIRDLISDGVFTLKYCPTKSQLADVFTKILPGHAHRSQVARLGTLQQSGRLLNIQARGLPRVPNTRLKVSRTSVETSTVGGCLI